MMVRDSGWKLEPDSDQQRFSGRVARMRDLQIVITGASGGIGSYLIENLQHHEIFGCYNSRIPSESVNAEFFQVDVTDAQSVESFTEQVSSRLKSVVLINLAGISLNAMAHKMEESTWDQVLDTNLKGTFLMSRALLPFMRDEQWGRIINISTIVGQIGVPGTVAYSASKSGLAGLTRTLAVENVRKNITANALALGYYNVGMINTIEPRLQEAIIERIPMKRLGDPKDIVLAVKFLIECEYITGSIININGGML